MNFLKCAIVASATLTGCYERPLENSAVLSASTLEDRVKELETAEELRAIFDGADRTAYLTPSDRSYSLARGDFGNVAVVLEDVENYANGVKVNLTFGNTTSANVQGLKAKLEWGTTDAQVLEIGESQTKEETFTDILPAASWQSYSVVLPHIPADKLGYVRVSEIKSSSISLMKR